MTPQSMFLRFCIPVRIALAILPAVLSKEYLPYYGWVLLLIGSAFQWLYWSRSRMQAPEAGGPTWWHNLRVVHGALYLAAGYLAVTGRATAWIPLAIDVLLGVYVHVARYYR